MNVREMLENIPGGIEETIKKKAPKISGRIDNIVVCGMGASGISGDVLRDYLKYESKIPVIVSRATKLPKFVGKNTLVFAITYSGKTEETLSSIKDAKRKRAKLVVISSKKMGGKSILVPKGLLPRMGLPYLFFSILMVLEKSKIVKRQASYVKETIKVMKKLDKAKVKQMADKINKTPIFYAPEHFACVVTRMMTQVNENAKMVSHYGVFTELNHNEIESKDFNKFNVVILRDREDKETQRFIKLAKHIIGRHIEIKSKGNSLMARMFYMIYFCDWISYFLALRRGTDPLKMPAIDYIKTH